ncbi:MAG: zinc protease [Sphingobacteriales bacterium]|jgi:zinc protease
MTVLDRKIAPAFKTVDKINVIQPESVLLADGNILQIIDAGEEEVAMVELVFPAGRIFESQKLISFFTSKLMMEGTKTKSGFQISEALDEMGVFMEIEADLDYSSVKVYSTHKHLKRALSVFADVLQNPTFKQSDIDRFSAKQKDKLKVNLLKNSFVARRKFLANVFPDHKYGAVAISSDYDQITTADLLDFHNSNYKCKPVTIIAAGRIKEIQIEEIKEFFSGLTLSSEGLNFPEVKKSEIAFKKKQCITNKKDALQSALRVGGLTIPKGHEDYYGLNVVNTILGGFFGSRLMKNIREDKGFTYGIGSGVFTLKQGSYFFIASEVGADVTKDAMTEIYKEIERLRTEEVSVKELEIVRNYMLGTFLGGLENAFSYANKFKGVFLHGLEYSHYDKIIEAIKTITPAEIKSLADKYLNPEKLAEVVVGDKYP